MSERGRTISGYIAERARAQGYLIRSNRLQGQEGWSEDGPSRPPRHHHDPGECPMSGCSRLMVYASLTDGPSEKSCPVHGKESRIFEQMGLTSSEHKREPNE